MANLLLTGLYGKNYLENLRQMQGISLQLHITAKCDQRCKHCYMYNSELYEPQINNPLSKEQMFLLLDEYYGLMNQYGCKGTVAITGGDPILSPYFWDLLEYIKLKYAHSGHVIIMGNSYHITRPVAERMKMLGIYSYQISIDGMQEKHDYIRKDGSFKDAFRALKILYETGIKTVVGFTVSKENVNELLPLYRYIKSLDYIDSFGFNRLIPTGNGKNMADQVFTADEYRKLLFDIYKQEVFEQTKFVIYPKEKMWKPLLWELGLTDPIDLNKEKYAIAGCGAGVDTISVLADGTVMPCRHMDITIGKYPDKSLKEIYRENTICRDIRAYEKYDNCSKCELSMICRGCLAMRYAMCGSIYTKEPYCWKEGYSIE